MLSGLFLRFGTIFGPILANFLGRNKGVWGVQSNAVWPGVSSFEEYIYTGCPKFGLGVQNGPKAPKMIHMAQEMHTIKLFHQTKSSRSSGQNTVGAGEFWGVLNVSLRASGTHLGLDLTCFVIRDLPSVVRPPPSVLCRRSSAVRHPSSVTHGGVPNDWKWWFFVTDRGSQLAGNNNFSLLIFRYWRGIPTDLLDV